MTQYLLNYIHFLCRFRDCVTFTSYLSTTIVVAVVVIVVVVVVVVVVVRDTNYSP